MAVKSFITLDPGRTSGGSFGGGVGEVEAEPETRGREEDRRGEAEGPGSQAQV